MGFMKKLYTEIEIEAEALLDALDLSPYSGNSGRPYEKNREIAVNRLTRFVEQQFIQSDTADWHPALAVYKAVLGEWHPKGRASLLKVWAGHLSDSRTYLQGVVAWLQAVAEALDK